MTNRNRNSNSNSSANEAAGTTDSTTITTTTTTAITTTDSQPQHREQTYNSKITRRRRPIVVVVVVSILLLLLLLTILLFADDNHNSNENNNNYNNGAWFTLSVPLNTMLPLPPSTGTDNQNHPHSFVSQLKNDDSNDMDQRLQIPKLLHNNDNNNNNHQDDDDDDTATTTTPTISLIRYKLQRRLAPQQRFVEYSATSTTTTNNSTFMTWMSTIRHHHHVRQQWCRAVQTARVDAIRAVASSTILVILTMQYTIQLTILLVLQLQQILIPQSTYLWQTYIGPFLWVRVVYPLYQYHVALTWQQWILEWTGIWTMGIVYYYCIPYAWYLHRTYLRPFVQQWSQQYQQWQTSMRLWYNHQYERIIVSSRFVATMTPLVLYSWMVVLLQLLVPTIMYHVIVHTNINTFLSTYIPILLSMIVLYNQKHYSNSSGKISSSSSSSSSGRIGNSITAVRPLSQQRQRHDRLQDKQQDDDERHKENVSKNTNRHGISSRRRLSSSKETTNKKRAHIDDASESRIGKGTEMNEPRCTGAVTSSSTITSSSTTHSNEMQQGMERRTVVVVQQQHQQQLQFVLQYWMIVRMCACLSLLATHAIPYFLRKLFLVLLQRGILPIISIVISFLLRSKSLSSVGLLSSWETNSTTTATGVLSMFHQHLEFYLYCSIYIIPLLTPTIVQEMIQHKKGDGGGKRGRRGGEQENKHSSTPTTKHSATVAVANTGSSDSSSNSITLIQIYYINNFIQPIVTYMYNTISSSSSVISTETYHTYIIRPLTKILLIVSYTSLLSESTIQYIREQFLDNDIGQQGGGRATSSLVIVVPTMAVVLMQYYPLQYLFIVYMIYIIPLYHCCIDTITTNTTTNTTVSTKQPYRTCEQWLQYWMVQTIVTSIIQSMSSTLYYVVPFSTIGIYATYLYLTMILSPHKLSKVYNHYVDSELQYIRSTFLSPPCSTTTTNSKSMVDYDTNHGNEQRIQEVPSSSSSSHIVQLWKFVIDNVPKAATTAAAKPPILETDDDGNAHEIQLCKKNGNIDDINGIDTDVGPD